MTAAFFEDRPVLVTGGTGLLGSWLVKRLLAARADVVCLVRDWVPSELSQSGDVRRVKLVRGDVCDGALIERVLGEYEIATVFHLAAQAIVTIANRNPLSTFETNVAGTWRVLEACRRSPSVKQILVASSDKAYGIADELPYREDARLQGTYPYDVSKSCGDMIAQSYAKSFGLPIVITRCGNFYGGGDLNWNRIIPGTIRSVLRGQRPVIRSDGKMVRDYFYIEDGAAAYMLLAERLAQDPTLVGEAFNFSHDIPLDVVGIVQRVLAAMNSELEPEILGQASNEIPRQYLSSDKARERLGWRPLFSMDEGLARTIRWYEDYLGHERRA